MTKQRKGCFAFDGENENFHCSALDVHSCDWKEPHNCPFYKDKKQYEKEYGEIEPKGDNE